MTGRLSRTWRIKDVASWNWRPLAVLGDPSRPIDFASPVERRRWLSALLVRFPILLGEFARADEVDVTTLEKGDNAFTGDLRQPDSMVALLAFIGHRDDVLSVHTSLTLLLENRERQTLDLRRGAGLWINIDLKENGALDLEREAPVYLHFALDTDVYAPRTRAHVPDNTVMAAINAPRLAGFLERLERDVPATLLDIDTESYDGTLGPRGFIGPTNALSRERWYPITPEAWRDLRPQERALLERLFSVPFDGREAIQEQVRTAKVRAVDALGSFEFDVPPVEGMPHDHRVPVEAEAEDRDGERVLALLHVVDGRVSELEISKGISREILELPPPERWSVTQLDW